METRVLIQVKMHPTVQRWDHVTMHVQHFYSPFLHIILDSHLVLFSTFKISSCISYSQWSWIPRIEILLFTKKSGQSVIPFRRKNIRGNSLNLKKPQNKHTNRQASLKNAIITVIQLVQLLSCGFYCTLLLLHLLFTNVYFHYWIICIIYCIIPFTNWYII